MPPRAVHPYLPRFAQGVTGLLCLEAIVFRTPWAVVAALALIVIALVAPRWSPVNLIFRAIAPPAQELEPVAPVRFAQGIAAVFLAVAVALLFTGLELAGWIVAGGVAALALFSAATGICVGCEIYRVVLARRTHDGDVRSVLGLRGTGPWVVVVSAPGCARCEPVARQVESIAGTDAVVRVDLARTPGAARLPVRSVPAVVAIGEDGHVAGVASGRLDRPQIEAVVGPIRVPAVA